MNLTRGRCVAMGLLLALTACWGGGTESSNGPADQSGRDSQVHVRALPEDLYPDVVRRAHLTNDDLMRASGRGSMLPQRVEFPPTGEVTSFVDDPPGRVVMSIVNSGGEPGPTYSDLDSYTWYLYGVDGRWRVFDLGELGLPDSEWADWNVVGSLSPDGRYASLQVDSSLLLFDMASAEVHSVEPKAGRTFDGGGKWTPDGLVAMGFAGRRAPAGVFIDADTGERRQWAGPSIYRYGGLNYDWDGTPVLAQWASAGDRIRGYDFYSHAGEVTGQLELPWALWGRTSVHFGKHRIAFHRQAADGKRSQRRGALIVTDRNAIPEHIVLAGDNELDAWPIGWLDDRTLLLETSTALVAWLPDDGRFYRLTRLDKKPEQFYYSIATDLVQPKPAA